MSPNRESIAIIGAGVSGIFAAIELKKLGYQNVTLYEKAERITSLTTTFTYDNHQFDLSTKLIPAIGLLNDGVYPPLLELIRFTGVTLAATPLPSFYDFTKKEFMTLPVLMQSYKKLKIISDFAKAYHLLVQINSCTSFANIYKTGIIKAEESIDEWAKRHDIEAFGTFTNYLVDLFNMGPSDRVPAGFVLVSRVHFVAPYIHAILSKVGVKHFYKWFGSKDKKEFCNFLDFEPKATNYYVVQEGYEEFFRRLIKHYDLHVECNSTVADFTKDASGISFSVNSEKTVSCDKVIFCCPPPAIASISYLPEVKKLLKGITHSRTIRTWCFKVDHWDENKFGKCAYVVDGTSKIGTKAFEVNAELMYISRETGKSNLIISPVYLDPGKNEEDHFKALEKSLNRFGMPLKEVVFYKDFNWPHYSSLQQNGAGWNEKFEDLQGKDGIYYSGECFSGIGVSTILEYSKKFINIHFN